MDKDFLLEVRGHAFEYIADDHCYLVDGVIVPSITQILGEKFPRKYSHVSPETLNKAAAAGTAVHEAIEAYCETGEKADLPELRGFLVLERLYGFTPVETEVPVILFIDDEPAAAGRLDLVLVMNGEVGGAEIKRTATLDRDYLFYQLNLYRIAYRQSYGIDWTFLRAIHLRNDVRKFVPIPINEELCINEIYPVLEAMR